MPVSSKRRGKAAAPHSEPPWDETLTLTISETARRLRISERHVYRLLDAGALPRIRMGRVTRISRAAVDAYAVTGD